MKRREPDKEFDLTVVWYSSEISTIVSKFNDSEPVWNFLCLLENLLNLDFDGEKLGIGVCAIGCGFIFYILKTWNKSPCTLRW